ncbi:MAG: hypothetical protein M3044_04690 [Thermoproteota archaeon]|nr:hypothetical protein [Thermoproteota archaeon]
MTTLRVVTLFVMIAILTAGLGTAAFSAGYTQAASAQIGRSGSNMTSGAMAGAGSNGNQSMGSRIMMSSFGPNITGSVALGPTIAKVIASQVHVSLANASTVGEKAVGANAHAAAVRIGVVHGFLVYMALVVDSSNNFHGVLVDAGNGKVLASTQMSMAAIMGPSMGMMGPSMGMMGPSMGMMGPSMGMMGPSMGMMGPSMMQPGMMMQHSGPGMYNPGQMGRPYP